MAERLGSHGGGIEGLLRLLDEHGEAVEYDLITLGLRLDQLGSDALTWRDLLVIVRHLPRTSALARAQAGDDAVWGLTEHLLAAAVDSLRNAEWQRAGRASAPKPKPIKRPGTTVDAHKIGADPIPIAEFDTWWAEGGTDV